MIINRNSELEKNMYAKLSQVDELISSNDVYALGLRLNALSSLCKALREDSAVKALTEALDKVIESGIIDSIDKNSLKHFMIGNAFYTASDFTGDDKYKNEAVKLAAGFKNFARNEAVNKDVTVEVQQSDSTTGVNMAAEGTADIGMASRDLKDEEKDLGLTATVIARDGIAVIVNKDNDVDELTSDQVKAVYTGETTTWEDLAK